MKIIIDAEQENAELVKKEIIKCLDDNGLLCQVSEPFEEEERYTSTGEPEAEQVTFIRGKENEYLFNNT